MHPTQPLNVLDEESYTPQELAKRHKLHPDTIIRMFLNEPDVIRLGHGSDSRRRRYYTLRIPKHVAERVFNRLRVKKSA
jgi:hypothetical protein